MEVEYAGIREKKFLHSKYYGIVLSVLFSNKKDFFCRNSVEKKFDSYKLLPGYLFLILFYDALTFASISATYTRLLVIYLLPSLALFCKNK